MATAVRPKKYKLGNGAEVLAIQVTESNYVNIAIWTKNPRDLAMAKQGATENDLSEQRVRINTPFGKRTAHIGDWVYRNLEDGQYYVVKNDVFEEKFFPVASKSKKTKEEK